MLNCLTENTKKPFKDVHYTFTWKRNTLHIIDILFFCLYLCCFISVERMSMPLSSSIVRLSEENHLWVSHRVLLRYSSRWKRKRGESWSASLPTLRKSKGLVTILPGVWIVTSLSFDVLCIDVGGGKRWTLGVMSLEKNNLSSHVIHSLTLLCRRGWVCDKIP